MFQLLLCSLTKTPARKQTFRELVSCSNCTDYQSRRLEVRADIVPCLFPVLMVCASAGSLRRSKEGRDQEVVRALAEQVRVPASHASSPA